MVDQNGMGFEQEAVAAEKPGGKGGPASDLCLRLTRRIVVELLHGELSVSDKSAPGESQLEFRLPNAAFHLSETHKVTHSQKAT